MSAEPAAEPRALGEVERAIEEFFVARASKKESALTREAYGRDLRQVLDEVARHLRVQRAEVTLADIRNLAVLRRAFAAYSGPRSTATVRRCHSTWSEFFKFLVSEDLVDGSPMAGIYRPAPQKRLPKAFAAEDEMRILTAVLDASVKRRDPWPELDLAVVNTFLATAVRLAELVGMNIGDVTFTAGNERVRIRGKGDKDRVVPIEHADLVILERYLQSRRARFPDRVRTRGVAEDAPIWDWFPPKAPLFVDRKGERLKRQGTQYMVRLVYRAAGVESKRERGALVHALRHTTATRWSEGGVVGNALKELLGHGSLQTTQVYLMTTAAELRTALAEHPTARRNLVAERTAPEDPVAE
jgi:integrase/recombinase XerD